MTSDSELAWLVDAKYEAGQINLTLIRERDLEPIHWSDSEFEPYYLTEEKHQGEPIKKMNLFTQNEMTLYKVEYEGKPSRNTKGWETEVDPALSYVYDQKLRFGILHRLEDGSWKPQVALNAKDASRFDTLFGALKKDDPLKYDIVKDAYAYTIQPVPLTSREKLGLPEGDLSTLESDMR